MEIPRTRELAIVVERGVEWSVVEWRGVEGIEGLYRVVGQLSDRPLRSIDSLVWPERLLTSR